MYKSHFLVLLAISSVIGNNVTIQTGYLGSKYLILSSELGTFLQALTMCRYFGMKLATVSSEERNSELYELFTRVQAKHDFYWIDGVYQNNSMYQGWTWLESNTEFDYSDWSEGQPRLIVGDTCLKWGFYYPPDVGKGLWMAEGCTINGYVLCELAES